MNRGVTRVVFADHAGALIHDVLLGAVPRIGDRVDLHTLQVSGVVAQVTWQVGATNADSRAVVQLQPHP